MSVSELPSIGRVHWYCTLCIHKNARSYNLLKMNTLSKINPPSKRKPILEMN